MVWPWEQHLPKYFWKEYFRVMNSQRKRMTRNMEDISYEEKARMCAVGKGQATRVIIILRAPSSGEKKDRSFLSLQTKTMLLENKTRQFKTGRRFPLHPQNGQSVSEIHVVWQDTISSAWYSLEASWQPPALLQDETLQWPGSCCRLASWPSTWCWLAARSAETESWAGASPGPALSPGKWGK